MNRFAMPSVVNVILPNSDGHILMLERSGVQQEWGLPAGKLESSEGILSAAIRELKEETGILICRNDLMLAVTLHYINRKDNWEDFQFFFAAPRSAYCPSILEPHKHLSFQWTNPEKIPVSTIPHVAAGIQSWYTGRRYVEYGWD